MFMSVFWTLIYAENQVTPWITQCRGR